MPGIGNGVVINWYLTCNKNTSVWFYIGFVLKLQVFILMLGIAVVKNKYY